MLHSRLTCGSGVRYFRFNLLNREYSLEYVWLKDTIDSESKYHLVGIQPNIEEARGIDKIDINLSNKQPNELQHDMAVIGCC